MATTALDLSAPLNDTSPQSAAYDDAPDPLPPIALYVVKDRVDPAMSWPPSLENQDPQWAAEVRAWFDLATASLDRYLAARAKHASDKRFTDLGRDEANQKTAEAIVPELAEALVKLKAKSGRLTENVASMTMAALKVQDSSDPHSPKAEEIRSALRNMPADQREDTLRDLVRAGDVLALRAVTSAPAWMTGLDPDVIDELREDVVSKYEPEQLDKIKRLREAIVATEKALSGVQRYLAFDTSPAGIQDRHAYPDNATGELARIRAGR